MAVSVGEGMLQSRTGWKRPPERLEERLTDSRRLTDQLNKILVDDTSFETCIYWQEWKAESIPFTKPTGVKHSFIPKAIRTFNQAHGRHCNHQQTLTLPSFLPTVCTCFARVSGCVCVCAVLGGGVSKVILVILVLTAWFGDVCFVLLVRCVLRFFNFSLLLIIYVCNNRKARVWIYSDCKCLLVWMYVFWRTRDWWGGGGGVCARARARVCGWAHTWVCECVRRARVCVGARARVLLKTKLRVWQYLCERYPKAKGIKIQLVTIVYQSGTKEYALFVTVVR